MRNSVKFLLFTTFLLLLLFQIPPAIDNLNFSSDNPNLSNHEIPQNFNEVQNILNDLKPTNEELISQLEQSLKIPFSGFLENQGQKNQGNKG